MFVNLKTTLQQSAEELRRRGSGRRGSEIRALGRKNRRGTAEPCDYLVKRPAERRRTDPLVTLSSLLEDVLNHMRHLPDVQPFLFPVNSKVSLHFLITFLTGTRFFARLSIDV